MSHTMLMPMETVHIPKLAKLNVECKWVVPYPWLCELLREHVVVEAGQVDGDTTPLFVLKYIAYSQETIAKFVSPDLRLLTQLTADIAVILASYEDLNKTSGFRELTTLPVTTFSAEEYGRLKNWLKQIAIIMKTHTDLLQKLQKQQMSCQKVSRKLQEAKQRLNRYRHKYAHLMDPNVTLTGRRGVKLEKLNNRYSNIHRKFLHELTEFMWTKDKVETLRRRIVRVCHFMKVTVVEAIADQIVHALGSLARVIESPSLGDASFRRRLAAQLQEIQPLRLAEEIYYCTSTTYTCPDLQNFDVSSVLDDNIPRATLSKSFPSRGEELSCDRQAMHGEYIILPKTSTNIHETLPGFFEGQKDLKIKQKLLMMEGKIGFGWSRRSVFRPHKTWGLFLTPGTRTPSPTSSSS